MKNKYTRVEIGIVIPALNPDDKLYELIDEIIINFENEKHIVIVNDGSSKNDTFEKIKGLKNEKIHILKHPVNFGKGEALKTGFKYLISNYPTINGIATMDSDGQHTVDDLKKCMLLFSEHLNCLILGKRTFSKSVPLRSRLGNNITKLLTRVFTGLSVSDTQTGLRIIPIDYAKKSLDFQGKRYAFEFDMLLQTKVYGISIYEQPIETIYIDENSASHFNLFSDSLSIYLRFLRFAFSGLISFLVDIIVFMIIVYFLKNSFFKTIVIATISARCLSAIVNYVLNRNWVFAKKGKIMGIKYGILLLTQMFFSAYLTNTFLHIVSRGNTGSSLIMTLSKVVADSILFLISYQVQKRFIFSGGKK